ncbi:hypothetical protein EAO71_37105 [Streptomyces sp. ms191]|nr:hypothetical protein EAO71_37105 [Streptomyces sp. ms191]
MWQPGPVPQGRSSFLVASLRDGLRPPLTARPRLPFHTRRAARGMGHPLRGPEPLGRCRRLSGPGVASRIH